MLKDIKTSTKVALGFGCVVIITLLLALFGRQGLVTSSEYITEIGKTRLPSVYGLEEIRAGMVHTASGYRGLINRRMMEASVRQSNYDEVAGGLREAAEGRKIYEPLPMTAEEERVWKDFTARWDELQRYIQAIVDVEHEKDTLLATGAKSDDPGVAQLDARALDTVNRARAARFDAEKGIAELVLMNNEYGKVAVQAADASGTRSASMLMLIVLLGVAVALGVGVAVARSISNSLNGLRREASRLAEAAVAGQLSTRADVMAVPAEFRSIVQGINDTLDAVMGPLNVAAHYVDRISKGDIPEKITDSYNGDFNLIENNLNKCVDSLNGLLAAMGKMHEGQKSGDIEAYVNAVQFDGAYRQLAQGVNESVKLIIDNTLTILDTLSSYAVGDLTPVMRKLPGKQVIANERMDKLRK